MSRIVLTTIGTLGDLHPQMAIAFELRKRGHHVILATHKEYQAKIEALGFEFHRMRPDNRALNDPEEMARVMDLRTGTAYAIKNFICANLRETYTDLMNSAKGADFILATETVFAARLVAEKLGIPWASVVLHPLSFLSIHDPFILPILPFVSTFRQLGSVGNRGLLLLLKVFAKSMATPIHALRRELELPRLAGNPLVDDRYSPYLVLALFSSAFAKPQPDWAANTVLTGFTFYDGSKEGAKLSPELGQFLGSGDPPIVFTLGSTAVLTPGRFYEESVKAAKRLDRRAVLLIGKNTPPKDLPDNIMAVTYAPYSQIFPHACATVHSGGIGTTALALRAGRPMLVVPYSHDQPDNAARVERLGTSRTISRGQYSAAHVAKQLHALLQEPGYATRAAEIGRIIQAENGVELACDAVEQQLQAVAALCMRGRP